MDDALSPVNKQTPTSIVPCYVNLNSESHVGYNYILYSPKCHIIYMADERT